MLTIVEKILFLIVAGAAVYYGYLGFRNVFLVIRRGSGEPYDMGVVVERAVRANLLFEAGRAPAVDGKGKKRKETKTGGSAR